MGNMFLPLIAPGSDIAPAPVVHQLVQERALQPVFNEHYLTHPLPDTRQTRAQICGHFLPIGAAIARSGAVWVYCGGPLPARLSIIMPLRSSPPAVSQNLDVLRTDFSLSDITGISGVAITTLERTVFDVARWNSPEIARPQIRKLLNLGADIRQARSLLTARGRFYARARALLAEFLD